MIAAVAIVVVIVVMGLAGAGLKLFADGKESGRAACMTELKAADDKFAAQATKISQDAADKVIDIDAAYLLGESQAKTRTIYVQKKGAQDVAKYPVFSNQICVLPADSLRNVNAARASFRVAADGVRVTDDGTGASPRPTAGPAAADGAVRDAVSAPARDAGGVVPADAGGRRPLGKMR